MCVYVTTSPNTPLTPSHPHTGTLHTVMLEYPPYGSLHGFLHSKCRGRIADSSELWSTLSAMTEEEGLSVEAETEAQDADVEEVRV